jgi:aryl-alcohol dehydrogenase-like predicted oxidoreductase
MKRRPFGNTDIAVSPVGFGAWQLNNPMWDGPDERTSIRLVHAALAAGCNFFDTAPGYGEGASERLLGRALAGRRQEAVICTKFGHADPDREDFSVSGLRSSLEASLRRLGTDYVDVFLLHSPPPELLDGTVAGDVYAELESHREAGKVRAYGASVDFGADLQRLAETTASLAAEVLFNAFMQDTRKAFAAAAANGLGLIAKVPLDSGWLGGKYDRTSRFDGIRERWTPGVVARRAGLVDRFRALLPSGMPMAQAALAFVLAHPEISTVIPGVKSLAQLEANLAAAETVLEPDLVAAMQGLWDDGLAAEPLPW